MNKGVDCKACIHVIKFSKDANSCKNTNSQMYKDLVDGDAVTSYCGEFTCDEYESNEGRETMIEDTLAEREKTYGDFKGHALITQNIKLAMVSSPNWEDLSVDKKEALEMVAHKIGRILNGDPEYIENFRDIAGYAQLVVNNLSEQDGATDARVTLIKRENGQWA